LKFRRFFSNPTINISFPTVIAFVFLGTIFTKRMRGAFQTLQDLIVTYFGWYYLLAVSFFLLFVLVLVLTPWAGVKLGPDDSEPEFSYLSWFAMLFSAGMGIGLLFYSVAEPVMHLSNPPEFASGDIARGKVAMHVTFLHWGLHAWGIYIVMGLAMAYFGYRHGLGLTVRSTLYGLLGDRINGSWGHIIEILAVFSTLFGVATSIGRGAMQINAGLDFLGIMKLDLTNQILLIVGITAIATISVVSGVNRGIRRLSELNLILALALLLFVLYVGGTGRLLIDYVKDTVGYLASVGSYSLGVQGLSATEWQKSWTMFYWGWWMSWSPFVGLFIARISRGRTIREFIVGVLLVPVAVSFLWLSVFGNSAIDLIQSGQSSLAQAVQENVPTALFLLLESYPLASITTILAVVVVATFFITSSDSASLVIDILTSEGDPDPPIIRRVFWALTEGAVAITLLSAGGLLALQTAAITTAGPFSIIILLICFSLLFAVRRDHHSEGEPKRKGNT
jgi:choline/glycine/proline betaine transport protein